MLGLSEIPDIYAFMNERCIPYGVNFELTPRCNIDCRHCYHVMITGAELDTAEVKRVLNDLANLGTFELTLTGGEPLLRRDFPEILRYAVATAGFSVKIFSNLTLLDEKTADVLASVPLNSVETTLLGPDAETHDTMTTVKGSFTATLTAIGLLKDRGIRVSAKTILMTSNVDKADDMYRLADNLDISFRHDDSLFVESNMGRAPLALQISDSEILRRRKKAGEDEPFEPSICNAARSIMSIGPDGAVYPCGAYPEAAGTIRETALGEIWYNSPLMNKLRSLEYDDYTDCRECDYQVRCSGCVAMGIGLAHGRISPCRVARNKLQV